MVLINRNSILSIEDDKDNKNKLIIRMNDVSRTIYICPKEFKMEFQNYLWDIGLNYDNSQTKWYHDRFEMYDVDLIYYINNHKYNLIELPEGTIEE